MNSIPFHGKPANNPDVYVYLGVDGLAHSSVLEAQKQGAFVGGNWRVAPLYDMFPATSDASWTRIMHTESLGGYEFQYYDAEKDRLKNTGLGGLLLHVLPSIAEPISFEGKYLHAFDYHANGYLHAVGAYHDVYENLAESLDNLFFLLEGRAETATSFSAYLLEFDVLGHMATRDDVTRELVWMAHRIDEFKTKHPERRFHFTLLSDHGMDFIKVPVNRLIELKKELPKLGIASVESLRDHDPAHELYAISVEHTRVSYTALHTHPSLAPEVARRISTLEAIDMTVSRVPPPAGAGGKEWFGIFAEGKSVLTFGFDPDTDRYWLPADGDYARLNLAARSTNGMLTDEEAFQYSRDQRYPDLFYKIRTALSPVGVKYPADVIASFKLGYVSKGFQPPGADDTATSGFHGSLNTQGATGVLVSEERDLPAAVRSDTFLELFPRMRAHILQRGVILQEGDRNQSLQY
jgi:hypothetical protein